MVREPVGQRNGLTATALRIIRWQVSERTYFSSTQGSEFSGRKLNFIRRQVHFDIAPAP